MRRRYTNSDSVSAAAGVIVVLLSLHSGAQQSTDHSQIMLVSRGSVAMGPALFGASGPVDVWIGLVDPPVSRATGRDTTRGGRLLYSGQQRAYARDLDVKQSALVAKVRRRGGRELTRVQTAHNGVAGTIDASQLNAVDALPGMPSIRLVRNDRLDLSETVLSSTVQAAGFDGTGIRVAVLDRGIDDTDKRISAGAASWPMRDLLADQFLDSASAALQVVVWWGTGPQHLDQRRTGVFLSDSDAPFQPPAQRVMRDTDFLTRQAVPT